MIIKRLLKALLSLTKELGIALAGSVAAGKLLKELNDAGDQGDIEKVREVLKKIDAELLRRQQALLDEVKKFDVSQETVNKLRTIKELRSKATDLLNSLESESNLITARGKKASNPSRLDNKGIIRSGPVVTVPIEGMDPSVPKDRGIPSIDQHQAAFEEAFSGLRDAIGVGFQGVLDDLLGRIEEALQRLCDLGRELRCGNPDQTPRPPLIRTIREYNLD